MKSEASLSHKEYLKIHKDYTRAATVADLCYVTDQTPGIERIRTARGFSYRLDGKPLRKKEQLDRIKKLAIPPAWEKVWISAKINGHIQATGYDLRGRKQYRYHPLWQKLRNDTKFHRLYEFGKLLPLLRLRLEEDLKTQELNEQKVLATVISLMERTYIRVGNNDYEKMYGSYGLTTLKDKHVEIDGDHLTFSFQGKKGIFHDIKLKNKRLAKAVKACRDIPGKELFQYYDDHGGRRSIDSGMVNNYIKEATSGDYTAKDFRTWAGTLNILRAFQVLGPAATEADCKKNIITAIDEVSKKLGNSRTICRKYYVHPGIIKLYEDNELQKYFEELDSIEKSDHLAGLTSGERTLMKILRQLV